MTPRGSFRLTASRWQRAQTWLRRGGLQMVHLNAVGWVAMVGPGAAVGVVAWGLRAGSWWPGSVVGALPGALLAWVVALIVDARHYARSPVGFQLGEHVTAEEVAGLVDRLRAQGIEVHLEPTTVASDHPPFHAHGFSIVGVRRDAAAISAALGPPWA